MEEASKSKNNIVSLGFFFSWTHSVVDGGSIPYRIAISLSPEARDLAEQSRDPRILTHSCVLRDTFSLVSPAMEASFPGFTANAFLRGALPTQSGLQRITVLALLILCCLFFHGVREERPFFTQPQVFKNPLWLTLEEQATSMPVLVSLQRTGAAGGRNPSQRATYVCFKGLMRSVQVRESKPVP